MFAKRSDNLQYCNQDLAPIPSNEKIWKTRDFLAFWVAMAATVITYMCGSTLIAEGMEWWQAMIVMFFGSLIIAVFMGLNSHPGTKYGIPFPVLCRASFGVRGANVPVLIRALIACGWCGIVCWIGADALYSVVKIIAPNFTRLLPNTFLGINIGQLGCFAVFLGVHFLAICRGMKTVKFLLQVKAPLLFVSGMALMVWSLIKIGGIHNIALKPPTQVAGKSFLSLLPLGLTFAVANWCPVAINISDFSRFSSSQKAQLIGQVIALPITMVLFSFIGVIVASASLVLYGKAIWNPVELISQFSNIFAIIAGVFIITLASLATNIAANIVSPGYDFSHLWPKKISFRTGGYLAITIGILIQPWKIMANPGGYTFKWLMASSSLLGALNGVMLADYYCLRKTKINVDALYKQHSEYWYKKGFNFIALFAFVCGFAPCVPGFLDKVGIVSTTKFWLNLYEYSWFLGIFISATLYIALHFIAKKLSFIRQ